MSWFREYVVVTDFPDGVFLSNLEEELRSWSSGNEAAIQTIVLSEGVVRVTLGSQLSNPLLAELDGSVDGSQPSPAGGLIAAHDPTPPGADTALVRLDPSVEPPKIHPSPRPLGMSTYFSSAGDTGGISMGPKLIFNMTAGDAEKHVDVMFNEAVLIKDGLCSYVNAPLGSTISAEIFLPDGETKCGGFVKNACMLGTHWMPFDTEDYGVLPAGFIMRLTVKNASGADGEADPSAFQAIARVEMYRATTV